MKKIGLVGCGEWGQYILRDLIYLGCKVTVVATSKLSLKRARLYQASKIVHNLNQLPRQDGLIVAVPTLKHKEVLVKLIKKMPLVPIFCEKPLTCDSKSAFRLANLAKNRLFVMDKWRYHQGIIKMAEIAKSKRYGQLKAIKTYRLGWGNRHKDVDTIWILLPHELAIIKEIMGYLPTPKSAIAEKIGNLAVGLNVFFNSKFAITVEISSRSPSYKREVQLHFEKALVTLDDPLSNELKVYDTRNINAAKINKPKKISFNNKMPLLEEIKAFLNYLDGQSTPKTSAFEGAQSVKMIEEIRKLANLKNYAAFK